jgi:ABC-type transport system substrate-binding protein
MFDSRNLFGFAAILFGTGFLVQSLQSANARIGPSVSLGSNPIQHYYQNCDQQYDLPIFTNNATGDFIVTDIYIYDGTISFKIDTETALLMSSYSGANTQTSNFHLQSGIRVPNGSTFTCSDNGDSPRVMISGYYAHP